MMERDLSLDRCQGDCVIYARYSSHNQRDVSIEQQVADCEPMPAPWASGW